MLKLMRYAYIPLAVAGLYLVWTFSYRQSGWRPAARSSGYKDFQNIDGTTAVKILQFYASPGVLTEGEQAVVCYGVANAKTVRLEPPVESLKPALNRCFAITPDQDTRYTLVAEGSDNRIVSESFLIQVKPDPQTLPKVLYFNSNKKQVDRYGHASWLLCYKTENAEGVALDPPVVPLGRAFMGCFYVAPRETTTYTLTATGRKARKIQRQITVDVRGG
jgi:hypothetical protein